MTATHGPVARKAGYRLLRLLLGLALALALPLREAAALDGRDYTRLIGPPEVLAYAASVASALTRGARRKFPQIEQSNEGGAKVEFCGKRVDAPDLLLTPVADPSIDNAFCDNGLTLVTLPFGRQVITLYTAPGTPPFAVTREQLFLAIAREVPRPGATTASGNVFVRNPYKRWREISPELPDMPIRFSGPPQRSVFWLIFEDLLLRPACFAHPTVAELAKADESAALRHCLARRVDGTTRYADGAAYNESPRIAPDKGEVAINLRRPMLLFAEAAVLTIDGAQPDDEALNARRYPLARQIGAIAKVGRLDSVPNLREFLRELTSTEAAGPGGYLTKVGLDPLPDEILGVSAWKVNYTRSSGGN